MSSSHYNVVGSDGQSSSGGSSSSGSSSTQSQKTLSSRQKLTELGYAVLRHINIEARPALQCAIRDPNDKVAFENILDAYRHVFGNTPEYYKTECELFLIGETLGVNITDEIIKNAKEFIKGTKKVQRIRLIEQISEYLVEQIKLNPYATKIRYTFPDSIEYYVIDEVFACFIERDMDVVLYAGFTLQFNFKNENNKGKEAE